MGRKVCAGRPERIVPVNGAGSCRSSVMPRCCDARLRKAKAIQVGSTSKCNSAKISEVRSLVKLLNSILTQARIEVALRPRTNRWLRKKRLRTMGLGLVIEKLLRIVIVPVEPEIMVQ